MGQYYEVVNLEDSTYLYPHRFGSGLKLMELSSGTDGVAAALAAMLSGTAEGQQAWFGKRIVITGDYADEHRFTPPDFDENLYNYVRVHGKEVSQDCVQALNAVRGNSCDAYILQNFGSISWSDYMPKSAMHLLDTTADTCWGQELEDFDSFLELFDIPVGETLKHTNENLSIAFRTTLLLAQTHIWGVKILSLSGNNQTERPGEEPITHATLEVLPADGSDKTRTVELAFPSTVKDVLSELGLTIHKFRCYQEARKASANA